MVSTTRPPLISDSSWATLLRCDIHCSTSSIGWWCGAGALLLDDLDGGVDQRRVALVEHEQDRRVAGLVAAVGLDGVVEPQHRRRGAPAQDAAAGVEPVDERGEAVGQPPLVHGRRVQAQAGRGDDAEGALAADEELVEVGAGGLAGVALGVDGGAVGQDHVQADDHVLDLAVAGRQLAGAAAGEPAADGGQGHRLRPVAAGEAVARAQLVLEVVAEGAGQHVGGERRVVDLADAREVAQVEHDAAVERHRRAAHPAAPGRRGDRDRQLVADRAAPRPPGRGPRDGRRRPPGPGPRRRAPRSWPAATSRGWPRCTRRRRW